MGWTVVVLFRCCIKVYHPFSRNHAPKVMVTSIRNGRFCGDDVHGATGIRLPPRVHRPCGTGVTVRRMAAFVTLTLYFAEPSAAVGRGARK